MVQRPMRPLDYATPMPAGAVTGRRALASAFTLLEVGQAFLIAHFVVSFWGRCSRGQILVL